MNALALDDVTWSWLAIVLSMTVGLAVAGRAVLLFRMSHHMRQKSADRAVMRNCP